MKNKVNHLRVDAAQNLPQSDQILADSCLPTSNYLVTAEELKELLSYTDMRSVKQWCKDNIVPLFKLGNSYFVHSWLLEVAILKILYSELDCHSNVGAEVIQAILEFDKVELHQLLSRENDNEKSGSFDNSNSNSITSIFESYKARRA